MNTNEREIRKLIDDWTQALRAKDIRKMMAGYASDVVVFDMRLPHKITGADALENSGCKGYRASTARYTASSRTCTSRRATTSPSAAASTEWPSRCRAAKR